MINYILQTFGFLQQIPTETIIFYNDAIITLLAFIIFGIWALAGNILTIWVKAWWQKCEIALEWTKTRSWKFHLARREKGHDEFRILNDGRPIEMRRDGIGIAPHKLSMFIFPSEFGACVSPVEIMGERYFIPSDFRYGILFNDDFISVIQPSKEELTYLDELLKSETLTEEQQTILETITNKIERWENKTIAVRYPNSNIVADEFVKFQQINIDPTNVETFGEFKQIEAIKEAQNPWTNMKEFLPYLIPILIALAIAYQIISQQNVSTGVNEQFTQCTKDLGTCLSQCKEPIYKVSNQIVNSTIGGMIK